MKNQQILFSIIWAIIFVMPATTFGNGEYKRRHSNKITKASSHSTDFILYTKSNEGKNEFPWFQMGDSNLYLGEEFCSDVHVRVEPDQEGREVYFDDIQVVSPYLTFDYSPPSGSFFFIGETQVVLIATDTLGNQTTCEFLVNVERIANDSLLPPTLLSPDGIFDKVRDRYGNPFRLSEIQIPEVMGSSLLCGSSGYFNLYFDAGCGMEGSTPVEIARRNVVCQVFSDLSAFIKTPNPGVKVNIWIKGITSNGALASATPFYILPSGAPALGGLVEGEVWKTINAGVDSYTGITSPLNSLVGQGAGYYHGYIGFNFSNPASYFHTDLTTPPGFLFYDLYTTALHEAMHLLGFISMIRAPIGQSFFGNGYHNYYSRYDSFLQTPAGQSLIVNPGACSPMYNYQFNPVLNFNILAPNPNSLPCQRDRTTCSTAMKFNSVSVTQAVYTPNCFFAGNSLSHFEDQCLTPPMNNQYFVTSDALGHGPAYMKRFPKPEERKALCELGYTVDDTYGNTSHLTFKDYLTVPCPGVEVAGVNDGIGATGSFTLTTIPGTPIGVVNILANDHNAVSFECLQPVIGGGSVFPTSGTNFTYTPTSNAGVVLLRYVPVSPTGKRGNITYIFIEVQPAGCPSNVCNKINNPGFEQSTSCGFFGSSISPATVSCWGKLSSNPALFSRNCTPSIYAVNSGSNPESVTGAPNDHYIRLLGQRTNSTTENCESVQTILSTPIVAGTYNISFWAWGNNSTGGPAHLLIAGSPNSLVSVGTAFTPLLTSIVSLKTGIPVGSGWVRITQTIQYTGVTPLNNLIIANYPTSFSNLNSYILIDDLRLVPQSSIPTFTPTPVVCMTSPFVDLNSSVSIPGGIFSGPGVINFGGAYSFDPYGAGIGNHILTYVVTDLNGCTASTTATIQVAQAPVVTFTTSGTPECLNANNIFLNALVSPVGGIFSGPGVTCVGGVCTFVPSNAGIGSHTITYSYSGGACPVSITATIQVISCIDICEITNRCLDFDGVDDNVTTPSPLNPIPPAFTVACWFRDDRSPGPLFYRIFAWGGGDRFEVGEKNDFLTFYSNLTGPVEVSSTKVVRDGLWHHVAAVWTSANLLTIYLDGQAVPLLTNLPLTLTNIGNIFRLGDWGGNPTSIPHHWDGRIDEFKIWDIALTPAQIQEEMSCSLDPNNINLLVHFPLDENIANGNNATKTNADNIVVGGADGTLVNFALSGNMSNWVDRGRDLMPDCNVDQFSWLEGNNRNNYSGRSKVYDGDIFSIGSEDLSPNSLPISYPTFTRRNSSGTIVWRYMMNFEGGISDFIRTDEGCFLLVGNRPKFSGDNKSFIARIDQNGNMSWLHEYNLGSKEAFTRIVRSAQPSDPNYQYAICGSVRTISGNSDVILFTLDNQGNIGWMNQLGNLVGLPTSDSFYSDLMNFGGGYCLTGSHMVGTTTYPVLYQCDNLGFQTSNSSQYQAGVKFLQIEPANNPNEIIVAGGGTNGGAIIGKVDASGTPIWCKIFPGLVAFEKLIVQPNGDIFVISKKPYTHNVVVKLNDSPSGVTVLWQKHTALQGESLWGIGDLVWYSGKDFFYSDYRYGNPCGANGDMSAVMYELDQTPTDCPFTSETPVSQDFILLASPMFPLNRIPKVPTVSVLNAPLVPLAFTQDSLCPVASCSCVFKSLGFSKQGTGGWYIPVTGCGLAPITLPDCPGQSAPIRISGQMKCKGGCVANGFTTWQLTGPNFTSVVFGNSVPYISYDINLADVQTPGLYTLTINGKCGTVNCQCKIQFIVPPCPAPCTCTQPAFNNAVLNGFSWQLIPPCQFRFTPKSLTSCDVVKWKRAIFGSSSFTTFATTTGNQSVTLGFSTGLFNICMEVTRTLPGGGTCQSTRCVLFNGDCTRESSNFTEVCEVSTILNGGFVEGAEAGGLGDIGQIDSWNASEGNPVVVLEAGHPDTNFIRLHGNGLFVDLLYQDSLNHEPSDSIVLSLAFRPIHNLILPGTDLVARLSMYPQESRWCDSDSSCIEILRIPIPQLDSTLWLNGGSVSILKNVTMPYLTFHVENPFIDEDISTQSVVDIDDICLAGYKLVANDRVDYTPMQISISPNPTNGNISIQFSNLVNDELRMQIIGIDGKVLLQKNAVPGSMYQSMEAKSLTQGMYFLQILSKNRILSVNKFIKLE